MSISIIAAMTPERVIGKDKQMPWHLPADLAHFKKITLNKIVIMGRTTFESIGKPLPKRRNIILTTQTNLHYPGAEVSHNLEETIQDFPNEELMIIGGAKIYQQTLKLADTLYLSFIDYHCEGDTFFPAWDKKQWHCTETRIHKKDARNPYDITFSTFQKSLKL